MKYDDVFKRSLEDPEGFWGEAAGGIDWYESWDRVLDRSDPPFYRWFPGGRLNTCYNAVDRHVEAGGGDRIALIHDSPVTGGTVREYTYSELLRLVSKFAGALRELGVGKGDTVIIYMPMVPEALISMLACARIGAVHSVVFGGFAPHELAVRIDDARPKLVIAGSCGIEGRKVIPYQPLLEKALEEASARPEAVIMLDRPQAPAVMKEGRDHEFHGVLEAAEPADCVPLDSSDPLYILYTSGTTGMPKGVVRDNGGHAVALHWSMTNIYGMEPGEVFWAASDVGWVVGHSYIVYAPLLHGCTTVMYEGKPVGTPDPGAFWRVVSQHGVKALFTAPTAIRAIRREDPSGEHFRRYDTSGLQTLFLAGERTDPATYQWASDLLGVPVIDHWWQTESGWAMAGNFQGLEPLPVKAGSAGRPVPGYDIRIMAPPDEVVPPGREGFIAVRLPLPPGCLTTLWGDDARFRSSYMDILPGHYFTGDGGYLDEDGYLFVMGRVDDVINVAGHRLSTGEMEEVLARHPDVAECAVVGVEDALKGQVPIGMVVLKSGVNRFDEQVVEELVQRVREEIGPIACFKKALILKRLPKTRSGKVLRGTIRKIADGSEYRVPSTIDDPSSLEEIEDSIRTIGYGKK